MTRNRWVYPLYNLLLIVSLPIICLFVLVKWRQRIFSKGGENWAERWGRLSPETQAHFAGPRKRWWWVHAVSMGEVKAIETFLRRTPASADVKILLSAVTPEALAWAREKNLADVIIAAP